MQAEDKYIKKSITILEMHLFCVINSWGYEQPTMQKNHIHVTKQAPHTQDSRLRPIAILSC